MVKAHPNATAAGGAGLLGIIVVAALGALGINVGAELGATIATALSTGAVFIGRNGITGFFRVVWRGANGTSSKP